jgi:ADP-heptose:LPS heptosyltransferase
MYEFIRRSDMYIGNDTGIMHMAAASNSLTFALFGLRDTLGEFRPTGKNVHVIHKKFLFPAWKRFLTKGEHYMSHLTPEYVYDEVVKYLDKK